MIKTNVYDILELGMASVYNCDLVAKEIDFVYTQIIGEFSGFKF